MIGFRTAGLDQAAAKWLNRWRTAGGTGRPVSCLRRRGSCGTRLPYGSASTGVPGFGEEIGPVYDDGLIVAASTRYSVLKYGIGKAQAVRVRVHPRYIEVANREGCLITRGVKQDQPRGMAIDQDHYGATHGGRRPGPRRGHWSLWCDTATTVPMPCAESSGIGFRWYPSMSSRADVADRVPHHGLDEVESGSFEDHEMYTREQAEDESDGGDADAVEVQS